MRIEGVPFGLTDWTEVPQATHTGESGVASWRTTSAAPDNSATTT
jgi:hypothetical protein